MDAEEKGFLQSLKKNPKDVATHSAYADWLDEHDRQYEAALQRGKAGLSEVYYKIRRKSDGLFSTGNKWQATMSWSAGGKMWQRLIDLHSHLRGLSDIRTYGGTKWDDLEVVFVEVRVTYTATLVLKRDKPRSRARIRTTVVEPLGGKAESESEE